MLFISVLLALTSLLLIINKPFKKRINQYGETYLIPVYIPLDNVRAGKLALYCALLAATCAVCITYILDITTAETEDMMVYWVIISVTGVLIALISNAFFAVYLAKKLIEHLDKAALKYEGICKPFSDRVGVMVGIASFYLFLYDMMMRIPALKNGIDNFFSFLGDALHYVVIW
ncbi:hypothetical protein PA25_36060 [Pseudoalteromonas sp. A25]|uniref:hypothetical protein n=1 Tax=Pseudoalteromonas sp. A25 TaxID=116092 RepID=UPI001260BA0A|nr:hypothetical protein [Pseudoalteromonas sp. A25]BBN83621.1 hypothetical protein PA25_36060 [Pseudoalteromonas sp. A25]